MNVVDSVFQRSKLRSFWSTRCSESYVDFTPVVYVAMEWSRGGSMSRRPRSHQIEDISVRRFEGALPDAWVSRPIAPDYGVDREVEIFTSGGQSTGIKFAVQLKATDNAQRGDRVRLKVSQLDYLIDYDLPCIVVRYDAGADRLRWQWATLISSRSPLKGDQQSFTYRFEATDAWTENTPSTIERTLRTRRALMNFPGSAAMPVRLKIDEPMFSARYPIERAVSGIIAGSGGTLVAADENQADVELYIRVKSGFLSVDFEMLGSMTFDLNTKESGQLSSAILYAMAILFAQKRLAIHARAAGSAILAAGHTAGNSDLAARASYAFADDARAQAELAILNNLHIAESLYYPVVLAKLIEVGKRSGGPEAVALFLAAALNATQSDTTRAASIHYSTANALRAVEPSRSLFHYNRARHLRPAYLKADYFLSELAGTLFDAKRYTCSSDAYYRAIAIKPTDRLHLYLGDALLFSGELKAATAQFDIASEGDLAQIVEEAIVKLELCNMLSITHGTRMPTNWSRPMSDLDPGVDGRAVWIEHLATVNALDPLAHFNLGVAEAKIGDPASALGHFVACAIVQSNDVEAWSNAIICAFQSEQSLLAMTLVHLSINKAGLDAYDSLRSSLISQGAEETLLLALDQLAITAASRPNASISGGITLRILDRDNAIVIGESAGSSAD